MGHIRRSACREELPGIGGAPPRLGTRTCGSCVPASLALNKKSAPATQPAGGGGRVDSLPNVSSWYMGGSPALGMEACAIKEFPSERSQPGGQGAGGGCAGCSTSRPLQRACPAPGREQEEFQESRWPCGVPGRTKTYDIENIFDTCMQYCLLTYINQLMSRSQITNQVQRCERQRRYAQRMKTKATSWGRRQPGNRAVREQASARV